MHANILRGRKVRLPKEVIYEGMNYGRIGIALAHVKESAPHYHNRITEGYLVAKGRGMATINGRWIRHQDKAENCA
ncbi:hypothetical protein M1590_02670 [Candidatus Marsarchaeota archaeon]|nr:hypothetical protein [Candidatus Marsarchaeota archaeon]